MWCQHSRPLVHVAAQLLPEREAKADLTTWPFEEVGPAEAPSPQQPEYMGLHRQTDCFLDVAGKAGSPGSVLV